MSARRALVALAAHVLRAQFPSYATRDTRGGWAVWARVCLFVDALCVRKHARAARARHAVELRELGADVSGYARRRLHALETPVRARASREATRVLGHLVLGALRRVVTGARREETREKQKAAQQAARDRNDRNNGESAGESEGDRGGWRAPPCGLALAHNVWRTLCPVSYTHLTLPTICSV